MDVINVEMIVKENVHIAKKEYAQIVFMDGI